MITLADSLVSASARPLAIRVRGDLSAKRQQYLGTSYWIVKEPVGLNYFRFQEEEFAILQMLDGRTSLDDIKQRYEEEFPPGKIAVEEIARFIGNLHQSGLLIADVAGQGDQLKKRRAEKTKKQTIAALTNILAIRFKGFDPEKLLNWLYPRFAWCYSPITVLICVVMMLAAGLLVTVQFDTFQAKLPSFQDFFAYKNWIWLAVTLMVTKVLHEFGHGLSCKHFGGECHEIGVMILVLTPCLYCNVSDSWMLPNKWHRAIIGAAGMYVEVVIAAACTFIWWFTEPGLLNNLCLSVMFVSSVSTILFNGNPLLRYDGYYILADIMEIPNLRQKSSAILNHKLGWWCLGLEPPEDPFLPQRNQALFALYTVAAVTYRWFIVIMILTFLNQVFKPYGLQILGQFIAMFSIYGLAIHPLVKLVKFLSVPGRLHKVKRARLLATVCILTGAISAIFLLPLPYYVICPLEVRPQGAKLVYVEVAGRIENVNVRPGQHVEENELLAELSNPDLERQILQLEGETAIYANEVDNLRWRRRFQVGGNAGDTLRGAEKLHESAAEQLAQKREDESRLMIVAPVAGVVFPPPLVPDRPSQDGRLARWTGTPFDKENEGAFLMPSESFCLIGDPKKLEAVLVIDQEDRNFVLMKQMVEIKLYHLPAETFETEIFEIDVEPLEEAPPALSDKIGGELLTTITPSGREVPLSTSYQARALLPNDDGRIRVGLRGRAKIYAHPQTIAERIWRFINRTFSFEM